MKEILVKILVKIFGNLLPIGWQGLASIVGLGVVIVALLPIIREWRHRKKTAKIIRIELYKEIDLLKQSLRDKGIWLRRESKTIVTINPNDVKILSNLENLFKNTAFLKRKEIQYLEIIISRLREWADREKTVSEQWFFVIHWHGEKLIRFWLKKEFKLNRKDIEEALSYYDPELFMGSE